MTDHKFTDDDVIKALEVHSDTENPCMGVCPYSGDRYCGSKMAKEALALINRQKKEIENLQSEVEILQQWVESAPYTLEQITESIKIEAIKEFAERLKENETKSCSWCVHSKHGTRSEKCDNFFPTHQRAYCLNYDRWESKIDTLVKEMTEESK